MASEYPGGPFSDIMEGFIGGWKSGLDIRKARNDLRLSDLAYDAAEKNSRLVGQGTKGTGGSAYMDPANTGGGSAGSAGDPGSSTGRRSGSSGGGARYTGSQEGGVDPGELAGYYSNTLGATPNETAVLMAQADAESSFRPNITHDGGIGYGLYGHNGDRLDKMYQFAGVKPGNPIPWQSQAAFTLQEFRSRPEGKLVNQPNLTPEQLTEIGMQFEQPKRTPATNDGNFAYRLDRTRQYMANLPQPQAIGSPDMATAGQGANAPEYRRAMEMPLPSERNRPTLGPPSDSIPSTVEAGPKGDYADFSRRNPGISEEEYNRRFNPATAPPRGGGPQAMLSAPAAIGGNRYAALVRNPTNPWGPSQPMTYGGDARNTTPIMPEYGGGVGGGSAMDFAAGSDPSPIVGLGNPPPAIGDRYQDYQRAPVLNDRQDYSSPGSPTGSDQWGEITGSGDPRRSSYGYRNGPDQFEVDPRGRYMYRRTYEY